MKELRLPIRRSARYCVLGEPSERIRSLWIVCHGYGQLASRFIRDFAVLDNGQNLVVAPEALSRFYLDGFYGEVGASWMTREDRLAEIEDQRNYLDALYRVCVHPLPQDTAVHVLGFSQGCATAARWAATTDYPVDNLVLWAGELPEDAQALPRMQRMNLYFVYGKSDPFLSDEALKRFEEQSRHNRLHVNTLTFEGKHQLHAETLLQLERILGRSTRDAPLP
jgi:predicted esterase